MPYRIQIPGGNSTIVESGAGSPIFGIPVTPVTGGKQNSSGTAEHREQLDPTEGRIIAVKICSQVLDACIWFSFDPNFTPDKDEPFAVFYSDEIPFLSDKTTAQLKDIHQWKLTIGPGARVRH